MDTFIGIILTAILIWFIIRQ